MSQETTTSTTSTLAAEVQPYVDAFSAGELTAAGLAKLIRPVCEAHGTDTAEVLAWAVTTAAPSIPTQRRDADGLKVSLPASPTNLPKKWLVVAAGVIALGVAGGGAIIAVVHSAGQTTRTIRGALDLAQDTSGFGENFSGSGEGSPCNGSGGYSDIGQGTAVTVHDATGKVVAEGSLDAGKILSGDCVFTFSVAHVPDSKFYGIEVSHRGTVTFARSEAGFAGLTLGN